MFKSFSSTSERRRIVLLPAIAFLVYANSLSNGFAFDDELYIVRNSSVTKPSLMELFGTTNYFHVLRPVTFSTFALNWRLAGAHPFGYHLTNALLHATVAVLVYVVLRTLLASLPQAGATAFVSALLFAVHPIHTEAVAWITGRSELLAAFFLLLAWLAHLYDTIALSLVCFTLALLSKESAIAFIPLAIAGDYARGQLKAWSRYGLLLGVAALYLAVLWKAEGYHFGEKSISVLDNPLASLPAHWRILNAFRIAWKYIGLHFFPATLSSDYSYNAIPLYAKYGRVAPAAIATAVLLGAWIWTVYKRQSEWILVGAIYFAGFCTTLNLFVPIGTIMAERLAYLPSIGFCLLIGVLWQRLEVHRPAFASTLLVLVVVALGTRTVARNWDWRNNFTLYSAGVAAAPGSAKLHGNLGVEYMLRGQVEPAQKEFRKALEICPDFAGVMEWYGLSQSDVGHDQQARTLLAKAVALTPKDDLDYDLRVVNLASELIKLGETDSALEILNQEIKDSPGYSRAWSNRAAIRYQRGEIALARTDSEVALHLDSFNAQAAKLLGMLNAAP